MADRERVTQLYVLILSRLLDYSLNTKDSRDELIEITKTMTMQAIDAIDDIVDELAKKEGSQ